MEGAAGHAATPVYPPKGKESCAEMKAFVTKLCMAYANKMKREFCTLGKPQEMDMLEA